MEAGRKAMLFREVNERIAELLDGAGDTAPGDFFCECGRDGCSSRVTLALSAYRSVRGGGGGVLARECGRARNRPWRRGRSGRLAAST